MSGRAKKPSTPQARANIEEAMVLVEEVQRNLERACQKLSPIRHGSDLYDKAGKLGGACYKLWCQLRAAAETRERMSLDSEPEVK